MAPLLKSGQTRWVTFDRSDIVVRDFGDTMVVAGKRTIKQVGVNRGIQKSLLLLIRRARPLP